MQKATSQVSWQHRTPERVVAKPLLDESGQAVEALAHIRDAGRWAYPVNNTPPP